MRIEVSELRTSLSADMSAANTALNAIGCQEAALRDVASDAGACDSQAYGRMRDYLERVRVPALQVQKDFLLAFQDDMRTDLGRLGELCADASGTVDTDAIQSRIDNREQAIRDLVAWQGDCGKLFYGMAGSIDLMCGSYRCEIDRLRSLIDAVNAYADDASIYAASAGIAQRLGQARDSLAATSFDAASASFDLSRVGDLSWTGTRDEEYWRRRNGLVLKRWLVLDGQGNLVGVRPEAAGELERLVELAAGFIGGSGDLSETLRSLSPDERYLLTWLVAKLDDPVMKAGESIVSLIEGACPGLADGAMNTLSFIAQGKKIPVLSDMLSFTFENGRMVALNVPNSIQRRAGYSDLVDMAGPLIGADIDTHVCVFTYGDKEYRLQSRDGVYGWGLSHGGEIGLYSRPLSAARALPYEQRDAEDYKSHIDSLSQDEVDELWAHYDSADEQDQPEVKLWVCNEAGQPVVYYDPGKTYWGFSAGIQPQDLPFTKADLHVEGSLTFNDPGLAAAAKKALEAQGVAVSQYGGEINVNWNG